MSTCEYSDKTKEKIKEIFLYYCKEKQEMTLFNFITLIKTFKIFQLKLKLLNLTSTQFAIKINLTLMGFILL